MINTSDLKGYNFCKLLKEKINFFLEHNLDCCEDLREYFTSIVEELDELMECIVNGETSQHSED